MPSATEIRKNVTQSIIDALQNGNLPPWRKTWSDDPNSPGLHTSLSTGSAYRGINQLLLQVAAMRHSFKSKWWGTYNQINLNGASVRKGEKATKVVLWKPVQRKRTDEIGEEVEDSFLVIREICLFNAEQSTALDQFRVGFAKPQHDISERYEAADSVIDSTGADIRYGGNAAYCNLTGDYIQLPHRHQFNSPESYYETAFHELGHWSEVRLKWDRSGEGYAMGELVAEISACMIMAELKLPTCPGLENHVSYLKHWMDGMSNDPKFIFRASAQASKVVDFLLSFSKSTATTSEQLEESVPF